MSAIPALLTLLGRERDVLSRLLDLSREERTCLLNGWMECLDDIVQEQSVLLFEQTNLSTRITETLQQLGAEHHLEGRVSLARFSEHMDGSTAVQIRGYYRELTNMADELQREGQVNWHLAQQALKYVDFTLKLIGQAKDGPAPYLPPMQAGSGKSTQLLMDSCA